MEALSTFLLDNILEGGSIGELLTRVYQQTSLPVIAFDISFNILAYSFPRPFYIQGWEQLATLGIFSEEHVLSHDFLALEEQILTNRASLIVDTAGVAEYKTAFGPVFVDNKLYAYIATVVEDAYMDEVLELNDLICRTIAITAKNIPASEQEAGESLLLGHPVSEALFSAFSNRRRAPYMFAVIRAGSMGEATRNYVKSRINSRRGCTAAIDTEGDIRLLFSSLDPLSSEIPNQLVMVRLSERYSCCIGFSDLFNSLDSVGTGIFQARLSADVRRVMGRGPGVSRFTDCYPEALCLALVRSCGEEARYYLKNISMLIDMFPKKHPEYISTLEAYCKNGFDSLRTAQAMGVHKNTVAYRIRRIAETLGLDPGSGAQMDALLLETTLYRLVSRLEEVRELG